MTNFETPADRRDELAADRDDAAECRDVTSAARDAVADVRHARADARAGQADNRDRDLDDRLAQVRRRILDRLARVENTTFDRADWPDLTAADLVRLRAYAAEQRRLAALDLAAVRALLDDLRDLVLRDRADRSPAGERLAAAQDRRAARRDRRDSADDRDDAARDRAQAAIERQLADPADSDSDSTAESFLIRSDESLGGRVARAVAESRQRVASSREVLTGTGNHTDLPATATNDADPTGPEHA